MKTRDLIKLHFSFIYFIGLIITFMGVFTFHHSLLMASIGSGMMLISFIVLWILDVKK